MERIVVELTVTDELLVELHVAEELVVEVVVLSSQATPIKGRVLTFAVKKSLAPIKNQRLFFWWQADQREGQCRGADRRKGTANQREGPFSAHAPIKRKARNLGTRRPAGEQSPIHGPGGKCLQG